METLEVLQKCTVEDNVVKLPQVQLERKEYLNVKKALEKIGGKWKGGKVAGFVFDSDPSDLLSEIASGKERNLKKEFQFFATPEKLARILVSHAQVTDEDTILEPSAGQGAIIKAINEVCNVTVDCYELMEQNRKVLNESGLNFNLLGDDFLADHKKYYTTIIANPPFTKNQDIEHLREMYEHLEDGGRVVCITSESWTFGNQKKQVEFREWLETKNYHLFKIESGEFKESGTQVGGRIVVIDKP